MFLPTDPSSGCLRIEISPFTFIQTPDLRLVFDSLALEAGRVPEQKQPSANAMMYLFDILLSSDIAERLQTTLTHIILLVQMNMVFGILKRSSGFSDKNAYRNLDFKIILPKILL